MRHAPEQVELKKTILKNLNRLGLLIEKNDSLQVISLFQLCENQLDKLNDDGEKIGYMNSYQKHRVRYYAKNDPSQLELKTKAEQKIVRSICEDYLGEYDLAFSCNEFHICTLTIQHIVNLYDVLRKVDNDDRLESIANRINTNLKILSDKIASIKEKSEEL